MKYRIYKNKPIPDKKKPSNKKGTNYRYPFDELEVGWCFEIPMQPANKFCSLIAYHNRGEKKFSARTIGSSTFIWRIK